MQICKATERELSAIIDLWCEMQSFHNGYDHRFYETKSENECRELARIYFTTVLADKSHLIFLAIDSGQAVGMIHLGIGVKPPVYALERFASIQEVVVTKSNRNRGLFKAMLSHAKDHLRMEKINLLEALVDVANPAIRAYEHTGFTLRRASS